jgi:hypothetical protein
MTSKSPVRSCEDVDETALSYAEVKALATGNPAIKEKMELDAEVAKLKLAKANHTSNQYRLEDNITKIFPQQVAAAKEQISEYQADIAYLEKHPVQNPEDFEMVVNGARYTDKKEAGQAILDASSTHKKLDMMFNLGEYRGFHMREKFNPLTGEFQVSLKRASVSTVMLGRDALGNITRFDNLLERLPKKLEEAQNHLADLETRQKNAIEEVSKPFAKEEELLAKLARLSELNAMLNMDEKKEGEDVPDEIPEAEEQTNPSPRL